MTNLDEAINLLSSRYVQTQNIEFYCVGSALEYIREELTLHVQALDRLTQPVPAAEQPVAFLPWDCVKPNGKGADRLMSDTEDYKTAWRDMEMLVVSGPDKFDVYKLYSLDHEQEYYLEGEHLTLVYRLKPRKQAEPTFKAGEYVKDIHTQVVHEVMQDSNGPIIQLRDVETNQPCTSHKDFLQCIDNPAPLQVGDWVELPATKRHVQITGFYNDNTIEFDGAHGKERCSVNLCKKIPAPTLFAVGDWIETSIGAQGKVTGQHKHQTSIAFPDGSSGWVDTKELTKINPPEQEFQVGDWVEVTTMQEQFQIAGFTGGNQIAFDASKNFHTHISVLKKIPVPARRFTFGDRVRCSYWPDVRCFIIGPTEMTNKMHIAVEGDTYRTVSIETLTLDTSTD